MLPGKNNDMHFNGPIQRWDEAIPLGNGKFGALIWGNGNFLRLSLDSGELWETTPYSLTLRDDFNYENLVRLKEEKRWDDIIALYEQLYSCPHPTKLSAGKIIMEFGEECTGMDSVLSLDDAEADIRLSYEKAGKIHIKSYLHKGNKAGFLLMDRMPADFSWRVECPGYTFGDEKISPETYLEGREDDVACFTFKTPERIDEKDVKGFKLTISDDVHYSILVYHKTTPEGELFVWNVEVSADEKETELRYILEKLSAIASAGYAGNRKSHVDLWHAFWNKSALRISEKMFENNWYITQYLLGACSEKGYKPMPLQGLWTADDDTIPPWKGDYHHDLNTEMSYYCYLKANHLEEGECFLDYLWDLVPVGQAYAKRFYHTDGMCLPAVMSVDGQPLGGWAPYSYSPIMQVWLCHMFVKYYTYTKDEDFLKNRVYPYLKETAKCITALLREGDDGMLYMPISSSPEIHDNLPESFLEPNSNFDLSLLRFLFSALTGFSVTVCPDDTEKWSNIFDRLPELAVNDEGVLRLAPNEDLNESHRHFSHLMSLYPLRQIGYDTERNKRIIDACVFDLERLGSGMWVGYSFPWMSQIYILQGNGEGAATQLEIFFRYFCSSNGFHLNGDYKNGGFCTWHYRPFTLEANMLAADAIQEMLLYSENDEIRIFPAVPERFGDVEFTDFRGPSGVLISAEKKGGKEVLKTIKASKPCTVTVRDYDGPTPDLSGLSYRIEKKGNDLKILFS